MANRKTGVDNVFRMLNLIFKEARHLGRIPAIGKFTMSPSHNLGNLRSDLCFEDYLDLSNGVVLQFEHGGHKPITSHLDWIKEEELDLTSYAPDKIHALEPDKIVTEKMNQHYDVLIRRDPTFRYVRACAKYKYGSFIIDFPHSEKVNQLTDEVLSVLGISRAHAMAAQHYFLSRMHDMYSFGRGDPLYDNIPLDNGYYVCMHVRVSDRDSGWPIFAFTSSKEQIKTLLMNTVGKGARIYIMSDVHRPNFFNFLKPDYRVYRYYDFPRLRQLTSSEAAGKTDNVMLYLVEKNIMKYATIKILPPHKGPMIYHLNTIYDTFALKDPPHIRKRD